MSARNIVLYAVGDSACVADLKRQLKRWNIVKYAICSVQDDQIVAYLEFSSSVRLQTLTSWWPEATFSERSGSAADVISACRQGCKFEIGQMSRQGRRSDRSRPFQEPLHRGRCVSPAFHLMSLSPDSVASPRQRSVSLSIPRAASPPAGARRQRGRVAPPPPPEVRSSPSAPVVDVPASASADTNHAVLAELQAMQLKMEDMDARITASTRLAMKKETFTDEAVETVPDDAMSESQRRNRKCQEDAAPARKRSRRVAREEM